MLPIHQLIVHKADRPVLAGPRRHQTPLRQNGSGLAVRSLLGGDRVNPCEGQARFRIRPLVAIPNSSLAARGGGGKARLPRCLFYQSDSRRAQRSKPQRDETRRGSMGALSYSIPTRCLPARSIPLASLLTEQWAFIAPESMWMHRAAAPTASGFRICVRGLTDPAHDGLGLSHGLCLSRCRNQAHSPKNPAPQFMKRCFGNLIMAAQLRDVRRRCVVCQEDIAFLFFALFKDLAGDRDQTRINWNTVAWKTLARRHQHSDSRRQTFDVRNGVALYQADYLVQNFDRLLGALDMRNSFS